MKTFVRHAVTLMAITVACQAGLALAEDYYWVSGGDQTTAPAGTEKAAPVQGHSTCNPCDPAACGCEQSCGDCDSCCRLGCEEECERVGIVGFAGLDSFKGVADGNYPSNFGAVTGLNFGSLLPVLEDYGLGWQTGLSYGIYDFDGRSSTLNNPARSQQQLFVTTGLFHKAKCDKRLSFGLVYDWMFNDQWGEYGVNPTVGQWRGQVEYSLSGCNAVGVWACARDLSAQQISTVGARNVTVTNRAISQANLFWHHKFCSTGADSFVWVGIPDHGRLDGDGSLIDWTFGASVQVPLSERLALYANGAYFHPSASAGAGAAVEGGYDVGMGVVWYFGSKARSNSINGKCAVPYMPVANNSNFLVEQNATVP
jgi:hypothetical protein